MADAQSGTLGADHLVARSTMMFSTLFLGTREAAAQPVDPALRAAAAPSAEKVRLMEEGKRAARLRQEEAARRASEAHAERMREKRVEKVEEVEQEGLRRRGAGRRLGTGSDDEGAGPSRRKPDEPKDKDGKDDPFRRLRERNPLGPDSSRGYQPPKRKVNKGG